MMTSPTASSNPSTNSERARITRKKKKKQTLSQSPKQGSSEEKSQPSWKSESQKRIYSSKLLKAIRHVSTGSDPGSTAPSRSRAVREAADVALAATAKGRSRWSRAVLTSRLKLKFRKRSNRPRASGSGSGSGSATGNSRSKKPRVSVYRLKGKGLPAVQRKAKVLSRLVPGCRKQPLPVILEETHDYIEAKHMQIRAMIELLQRLGSASSPAM